MMRVTTFALLGLLLSVNISAAPPGMEFAERAINVTGVTPSGKIAFFGIAHDLTKDRIPMPWRSRKATVVDDEDRDGVVSIPMPDGVPRLAIWIAVEVTTGEWRVAGSPGYKPLESRVPTPARTDSAGQLRHLTLEWPEIEVLIVRPGTGAWRFAAAKTSGIDESRKGEPLRVDIRHAVPLGGSPQVPPALRAGDVIAVINPAEMVYTVAEVGK